MNKKRLLAFVVVLTSLSASAQSAAEPQPTGDTLTFSVRFPLGVSSLSEEVEGNRASLSRLYECVLKASVDSSLVGIRVGAYASPEGSMNFNRKLTRQRTESLSQWITQRLNLSPGLITLDSTATLYDWQTLYRIVSTSSLTERKELLVAIDSAYRTPSPDSVGIATLRNGAYLTHPWLQAHAYPQMRNAYVHIVTTATPAPRDTPVTSRPEIPLTVEATEFTPTEPSTDAPRQMAPAPFRPLMGIRTNLLYDAVLVPNLGIEMALGDHWSLATNWAWAWWSKNDAHRYWRIFGGELNVRRWFGSDRPLTGHHVGLYGEALTYDVMLNSRRGYLGGRPGCNLLSHPAWNTGLEYGFSRPLTRHLNLDFTLGAGYFTSTYYEYTPIDIHNVWQRTKKKQWVGPGKAEISLVWMLGRRGEGPQKGGEP